MFDWYRNAVLCIAYLADVEHASDEGEFAQSEWFKRGWTLQELLAPRLIVFVTQTWHVIGNRGASTYIDCGTHAGPSLEKKLASITSVPEQVLHDYATRLNYSTEEKLAWMEGRATTRPEDMSYALFGIFGVTPGANYGEKHEGARQRLLDAVRSKDNARTHQADRYQRIVGWLAPPDPWTNHSTARQLHESGIGSWLLQSTAYQAWKSSSTRHLWMYGKAGCGKTILCSTAIEDVKAYCDNDPHIECAVFYFTFSDERKQRLPDLLRSLVAQLGWKEPAVSKLQHAFDKPNRSMLGMSELEDILLSSFQANRETFLLIDALDECPENNDGRYGVVQCLTRLLQRAQNVKVCVTSRELPNIRESMAELGALPQAIDSHVVDQDIRRYTTKMLSLDSRLSRLDRKTTTLIEETISEKANGMFRWAYCQLQELKKLKATKPKYVKELLHNLPATLDDTYERILSRIGKMYYEEAFALLQWLAYAQSPLSLSELVEVTIIDVSEDGNVVEDERCAIEDSLEILSELVILQDADEEGEEREAGGHAEENQQNHGSDQFPDLEWENSDADRSSIASHHRRRPDKDMKVRLAHFSVKEYLESTRPEQRKVLYSSRSG
ncbi:putative NACHT nucleoside triphosphatase, P-loop containing nucleoside triphosphate hydrolase [Septoria linicola]|nr:putative NACHT nucleoside triphosphatase, P-loop containing nucleoside triphosphate hydrolase [Septoria linicola]